MKKKTKILLAVLLLFTISITTVSARSYVKELFQAGENLKIKEELDGTAFLAGTKVSVEKSINGIGFIAGETVTIKDKQEHIISASSKINMEADIEKDMFIFSEDANITGNVKRDSYIYGSEVNLDGTFGRNVYVAGAKVEIKGTVEGNITINATEIEIDDEAKIIGTLKYNDTASIKGLVKDIETKTYELIPKKVSFTDYLYSFVNSYVNILVIALLMIYVYEKIFTNSIKLIKKDKISNICIKGFMVLIGLPIIAFMLLMTGVMSSLGIVLGVLYGVGVYLSTIFSAYYLASELDKRYFKKNMNSYKLIIIGLIILKVLTIVPMIGGFISLISLMFGLGILSIMIMNLKK